MKIHYMKKQYDILVVGTGLAGIRAAVSSSNAGKKAYIVFAPQALPTKKPSIMILNPVVIK